MKVVFDRAIFGLEDGLRRLDPTANCVPLHDDQPFAEQVQDCDALFVRTQYKIDKTLVEHSKLRFVATASAGFDHVDVDALMARKIQFAYAPGCNAKAVAQWTLCGWLDAVVRAGAIENCTPVGIVGVGAVGSLLAKMFEALGVPVMLCDPPRQRRREPGIYWHLDELLEKVKTLTLHVPWTKVGADATDGLLHAERIEKILKNRICLINTSRGEVISKIPELSTGVSPNWYLDVWSGEPHLDWSVLGTEQNNPIRWATPHVAGYSEQSKLRATDLVLEHYLNWRGLAFSSASVQRTPVKGERLEVVLDDVAYPSPWAELATCLAAIHDLQREDRAMRAMARLPSDERTWAYRRYRASYPLRPLFEDVELVIVRPSALTSSAPTSSAPTSHGESLLNQSLTLERMLDALGICYTSAIKSTKTANESAPAVGHHHL